MKTIGSVLLLLSLCACATNPAAIQPRATDYKPYLIYDCANLTDKVTATDKELRRYLSSQSNARVSDAITWPIPLTRMFGKNRRNVEAISRLGGELDALKKAQTLRCTSAS